MDWAHPPHLACRSLPRNKSEQVEHLSERYLCPHRGEVDTGHLSSLLRIEQRRGSVLALEFINQSTLQSDGP